MNLEQLIAKLNQYKSAAELKFEDAEKALNDEDFETAKTLREEGDALVERAEAVKDQIESKKKAAGLSVEEEEEDTPSGKAARIPFDTEEEEEDSPSEKDFAEQVYQLRYGEPDAAVKAVIKDMWGNGYYEKRANQTRAFAKYLRRGESHLSAKEAASLQEIIYMPETVLREVKAGYSVSNIKANKATQQESSLELGGYLVPEDFRLDVIRRLMGQTVVRGRARQVTTVRDKVEWPRLEGGNDLYTSAVRVTWVDELPSSATVAETDWTVGTVSVPVHTVMARTDVSRNLLEDSGVDVVNLTSELFSEAMAIDEDSQFLTGDGGGTPKGILGNRSGAEQTPETGITTAASGDASAVTADGIYDLVYSIAVQYLGNAVMVGARNTFRDIRKLKDAEGQYLWQPGLQSGQPPMIVGYDFFLNENMPAVAANAYPLIFGDFAGYLVADRVGMTVERVQDTTTVGRNYVALFARRRLGGQVIEPWRFAAQQIST